MLDLHLAPIRPFRHSLGYRVLADESIVLAALSDRLDSSLTRRRALRADLTSKPWRTPERIGVRPPAGASGRPVQRRLCHVQKGSKPAAVPGDDGLGTHVDSPFPVETAMVLDFALKSVVGVARCTTGWTSVA